MTRKQFFGSMAGLLGLAVLGGGCTKSDDEGGGGGGGGGGEGEPGPDAGASQVPSDGGATHTPDAPPAMACTTGTVSIGGNHGHTLMVSQSDVATGADKTYNIQGSSAHPHTVVVTAAMFATLKASRTVQATSSNNSNHTHSITVTC